MTRRSPLSIIAPTLGVAALSLGAAADALAQSSRPYLAPMEVLPSEGERGSQRRAPPPAASPAAEDWRSAPSRGQESIERETLPPVESGELPPVGDAPEASDLPSDLWRGLDAASFERLISDLQIPPRSPALHRLWKRLITARALAPSGTASGDSFAAVRLEVLYQSGLAEEAARELEKLNSAKSPIFATLAARNELAMGRPEKSCDLVRDAVTLKGQMPKWLKGQALMMSGYCAALKNDSAGAGLAAEMAREEGIQSAPGLEALYAISIGSKPKLTAGEQLSLLDYKIAERAGAAPAKAALDKGEPALLVALSNDPSTPADIGLLAAEAAVRLNALSPETLASIYRVNAGSEPADALLSGGGKLQGPFRRAALFKSAETEATPMKKTRLMRALLDDAKHSSMLFQTLQMLAPALTQLTPQPEIGWFAESAVEISLAAGQYDAARRWISASPDGLAHWLALADIADPAYDRRGQDLVALEPSATSGRFSPDGLHRLATVLDALLYNVPIPLWNAMSRTPQPAGGYLPPTGVLTELQDAAKQKEFGRTVLLAMKALGPTGAEGAHMIALGDAIRALKRAGMEADARRLGLEALMAGWPRADGGRG